jgi:hypothetical protein
MLNWLSTGTTLPLPFTFACTESKFYFSSKVVLATLKSMADASNMNLSSLVST